MKDRSYQAVTAYVTPAAKEALRRAAFEARMSVSEYVESLIEKAVRGRGLASDTLTLPYHGTLTESAEQSDTFSIVTEERAT